MHSHVKFASLGALIFLRSTVIVLTSFVLSFKSHEFSNERSEGFRVCIEKLKYTTAILNVTSREGGAKNANQALSK